MNSNKSKNLHGDSKDRKHRNLQTPRTTQTTQKELTGTLFHRTIFRGGDGREDYVGRQTGGPPLTSVTQETLGPLPRGCSSEECPVLRTLGHIVVTRSVARRLLPIFLVLNGPDTESPGGPSTVTVPPLLVSCHDGCKC